MTVPNPTEYTKFDKYTIKTQKRNWSEILSKLVRIVSIKGYPRLCCSAPRVQSYDCALNWWQQQRCWQRQRSRHGTATLQGPAASLYAIGSQYSIQYAINVIGPN